jgi:hypothetical protein
VLHGATYEKGSVPAAGCSVTDAEDTNESATPVFDRSALNSDGLGFEKVTCSYTDGGGLKETASATYNIVDSTAPVITKTVTGQQGANGWYTGNVNVDWTVSEPQSPNSLQLTGCNDQNITADQAETTYKCSATSSGGSAPEQSVTIKRDATAPTNIQFVDGPDAGGSYEFGSVPDKPTCDADFAISGKDSCVVTDYSTAVSAPGTHTMTATAKDLAGNQGTATRSYTVTKASQTINFTSTEPTNAVYGDTYTPAANGGGSGNAVTLDASGACSYSSSTGKVTMTSTGTCTVTADQAGNANYNAGQASQEFSVGQRPVTVTPDSNQSKVYGENDPTLTYDITSGSLVGADDFEGSLDRALGSDVGSYAINLGSLSLGPNYDLKLSSTPVNFEITQRPITVTADPQTKTYGDADPAPLTYDITSGSLVGADEFDGSLARDEGENVGTYAINQGTVTVEDGNDGNNYDITYVGANLVIDPATLTVNANNATAVYGDSPTLTPAISGFKFGENANTAAGWLGEASCSLTSAAGTNVDTYPNAIECTTGDLAATNYVFVNGTTKGTLTITQRPITVTPDSGQSKVYGTTPDPTLTFHLAAGSTLGFTDTLADATDGALSRASGETVAGGPYAIQQGSLKATSNYTLNFDANDVTFAITPKPITVTADNKTKQLGANDPPLTYSVPSGSLAFNDTLDDATDGALSRAPGETVAGNPYTIGQGSLVAAANGNYTITFKTGTLTIVYGSGFLGFQQPINGGLTPVLNTMTQTQATQAYSDDTSRFKLGSTVPVKFELRDANGAPVTNATNIRLFVSQADSKPDPGVDEVYSTSAATTGNLFRLADATTGQYIFNLSTKSGFTSGGVTTAFTSQGTYKLSAVLDDGTSRSVNIQLVK